MKKLLVLALVVIIVVRVIYFSDSTHRIEIKVGDAPINVAVVDSQEERAKGLSGRDKLPEGEGMLFIFEEPGMHGFWMKDMSFAIDIVWIGEDLKVLGFEKGVKPETYPEVFYPPNEVKYVLEVPAGFSDTMNLEVDGILSIGQ